MNNGEAAPSLTWASRLRGWTEAERLQRHENKLLLVLTLLIGAVVGLVVVAFIVVTERLGARLYPADGPAWHRLAIPTAGALLSGLLLSRYFPNARGSGIPQTKTALFLHRGHIRLTTVLGKFGCSSISLASGIALGREGPTVQVGAGIASVLGRRLGLGPERVRALVPIGTSAALAAAFNTPIAAVLFTLEEILGNLHAPVLGSIVISSATSWAVLHLVLGDEPLFHVPAYQLVHPIELPVYAVLGVMGGLVSVVFVKLLLGLRLRFLAMPASTRWWQPAVGGLAVGLLGWFVPDVLGVGYAHVGDALNGKLLLGAMALLLGLKLVATATCYASGNAGGIFGPSLFIGAMLGGAVGSVAHAGLPDLTGSPGAYALVGMGAAFAGIVRAPMTSVIMIFEITRDYSIIVPVMIANLLSYFISQRLQPEPVYEALLHQDHIQLPPTRPRADGMSVEQAMRAPAVVLRASDTVAECLGQAEGGCPSGPCPVVDGDRFLGMLTERHLQDADREGHGTYTLGEVLSGPRDTFTADTFPHVHVDQTVDVVLQRMGRSHLDVLPVVSRTNLHDLLGVIALSDLPTAYSSAEDGESAFERRHESPTSARALLSVVIAGVLGLFLLGGFLAHQYTAERIEKSAGLYRAGNALLADGRVGEAIEQYRAALSLSHSDEHRLALGLALARADRGAEAKVYLNAVLRADPASGPANFAMARLSRAEDDRPAAVAWYRQALNGTWPASAQAERFDAAFEFVKILEQGGDRRQAIAELLQLTVQTADPRTLNRIGRELLAVSSFGQAADVFHQILRASPTDAAAFAGLGHAELAQENYRAAKEAFEQSARLDPSNAAVREQVVLCDRVLALDPGSRGLPSIERYGRSRRLLAAVLAAAEACSAVVPPGDPGPLVFRARQVLKTSRPTKSLSEGIDDNVQLAEELWASRPPACVGAGTDAAVTRVLARLQR
jgi:chloride channel protein, CIC family